MEESTASQDSLPLLVPTDGIPEDVLRKVENTRGKEVVSDSYPYATKLPLGTYEGEKAELQV